MKKVIEIMKNVSTSPSERRLASETSEDVPSRPSPGEVVKKTFYQRLHS
jgi:hypothetical protein